MRRILGSGLVVVLLAIPIQADDKKEETKDRKTQFNELKKRFQKEVQEFRTAMNNAKTAEDQKAALEKRPKYEDYAAKVAKLIDADPKDDFALDMIMFNMQLTEPTAKVYDLLIEHHVANPKIKDLLGMFVGGGPKEAKAMLAKVVEKNPNKEAKGFAALGLGNIIFEEAEAKDSKAAREEAEKWFDTVSKEYADVKLGRSGTLGDQAKGMLFEMRNLVVGKPAPEIEGTTLDGKKQKLSDYKGKVVVVDIWATWCGPCRAMIPHERAMVKKLEGKPFSLISVSADDDKETLTNYLKKEEMPWVHWWNGRDEGIVKDWNIRFFPTIYVIDQKGVIRFKNVREKDLEEGVEKLLAESSK